MASIGEVREMRNAETELTITKSVRGSGHWRATRDGNAHTWFGEEPLEKYLMGNSLAAYSIFIVLGNRSLRPLFKPCLPKLLLLLLGQRLLGTVYRFHNNPNLFAFQLRQGSVQSNRIAADPSRNCD